MTARPRIAHFAGSNATIMNIPPLVTSNKAREKYGLALLTNADGNRPRFDVLRAQRLAAPVTIYVEQFSAHPLERDAAELYGPPDGYVDRAGAFHRERRNADDTPVYEITLRPEDGLYPLPYMARQSNGRPWEEDCAQPGAPASLARQPFYPDGSRAFEEIDRFGISGKGIGNLISARADVDFYRAVPPAGYTKGLPADRRTDVGAGDIEPEALGRDFFPYRPHHLSASPPRAALARITNIVQRVMATGDYAGAIWTQGSPRIEETVYWLNLLIDTTAPICGNASQRLHGMISNDGDKNLVDSVEYITSRVWADDRGRNRVGVVLIQDQRIFAARDVQKADARPGGYVATGGHGGILGAVGHEGPPTLTHVPTRRHTYDSLVNFTRLSREVVGVRRNGASLELIPVQLKDSSGELLGSAIPKASIVKDGNYIADGEAPEREADLQAQLAQNLDADPLAGFVVEGHAPFGTMTSGARAGLMRKAVLCGMPVVAVGRGNNEGFTAPHGLFLGGRNLTATKARLLLMACLMRLGSLPPAADPDRPTEGELAAVRNSLAAYQEIFDSH
jgi:hypothetical protein